MRYVILFLLSQNFLPLFAQTKTTEKLLNTELTRFEAMVSRDSATLQRLLASDLIYLHSNSMQENKAQHIAAITSGKIVYKKMKRGVVQVRRYGKIAITNGDIDATGEVNGKTFDIHLAYSAVYRKRKKTWQLLNWQSTKIP